jgi:hypothetical protein
VFRQDTVVEHDALPADAADTPVRVRLPVSHARSYAASDAVSADRFDRVLWKVGGIRITRVVEQVISSRSTPSPRRHRPLSPRSRRWRPTSSILTEVFVGPGVNRPARPADPALVGHAGDPARRDAHPARRPISGQHRGALGRRRGRQAVCFWAGHRVRQPRPALGGAVVGPGPAGPHLAAHRAGRRPDVPIAAQWRSRAARWGREHGGAEEHSGQAGRCLSDGVAGAFQHDTAQG